MTPIFFKKKCWLFFFRIVIYDLENPINRNLFSICLDFDEQQQKNKNNKNPLFWKLTGSKKKLKKMSYPISILHRMRHHSSKSVERFLQSRRRNERLIGFLPASNFTIETDHFHYELCDRFTMGRLR